MKKRLSDRALKFASTAITCLCLWIFAIPVTAAVNECDWAAEEIWDLCKETESEVTDEQIDATLSKGDLDCTEQVGIFHKTPKEDLVSLCDEFIVEIEKEED